MCRPPGFSLDDKETGGLRHRQGCFALRAIRLSGYQALGNEALGNEAPGDQNIISSQGSLPDLPDKNLQPTFAIRSNIPIKGKAILTCKVNCTNKGSRRSLRQPTDTA